MAFNAPLSEQSPDLLLSQADKIFHQRKLRFEVIDRDLLGEPAWDILLYAYILYRRGLICDLNGLKTEVNLSFQTAKRWVELLEQRKLLIRQEDCFTITEEAEFKLSKMFREQLREMAK